MVLEGSAFRNPIRAAARARQPSDSSLTPTCPSRRKEAEMSPDQRDADYRTAIYASTSTHSIDSIDSQLEAARSHAEQTGPDVVGQYIELRGLTTQFLQMMAATTADRPLFRKILMHSLSRISRGAAKINHHLPTLETGDLELISVTNALRGLSSQPLADFKSSHYLKVLSIREITWRSRYGSALSSLHA